MRHDRVGLLAAWIIVGFWATAGRAEGPAVKADWVLKGGLVVDGTGTPGKQLDMAIRGDRIVALEEFELDPGARQIDASARVVAPGFIDLHSRSDGPIIKERTKANRNYVTRGVTTVVTGNCGSGPIDVAACFPKTEQGGAGMNVIHLVPHGSVRRKMMGNANRKADAQALERMRNLVDQGTDAGARGMSTGLIYLPGRYADTAELIELAKIVARHGRIFASHMRGEGGELLKSIDEAITIGREAGLPVRISHLKASREKNRGLVVPAPARIKAARDAGQVVTADQYPYIAPSTSLAAMVVPEWARHDGAGGFAKLADDPDQGRRLRAAIANNLDGRDGGSRVRIARYSRTPSRVGSDLAAITKAEATTPPGIVVDIERHGGARAISFGMSEDDSRRVMVEPFVTTASDDSARVPGADRPHPRACGAFPRKIRYALDDKIISLEQAVRSCSGLPAEIPGSPERGVIRVGSYADVVVFDPETVRDASTLGNPTQYAPGVMHLVVNGAPEIADGQSRKALAGRMRRLQGKEKADLIIKVGRIWTGDPEAPRAEALAVRDGTIIAVGKADDLTRFQGPKTRVFDRSDAFATPGLVDAHGHMTSLGSLSDGLELRGVNSPEAVAERVEQWIADRPHGDWVIGNNFDQNLWPGGRFAPASVLDAVAPNRPVWLIRVDGHAGWANSEAMRRAGVNAETRSPPDGQVLKDDQGRPLGVFIDRAKCLINRVTPRTTREDTIRRILSAQDQALKAGLTGVHDAEMNHATAEVYRELDRQHKLKLRVYGMLRPRKGSEVETVEYAPVPTQPGDRFTLRAIKLFIDGALGSQGALLFEPYADDPGNTGLRLIDPEVLEATTTAALRQGWQVCVHAIGDKGNALVLDAYAAALKAVPEAADPRLRIEHAQVVRRQDVSRFAALGVIASMQPSHASDDMRWADARLGKDSARVQGAYAWRWFLDANVKLAFGSDFPVAVVNPFWGVYAGITRADAEGNPPGGWHPDQKLTMDETLRAFTAGSAYAGFNEDRLGVLKTGMRADLTVIDRDLFKCKPDEVLASKVVATIIDGEIVYENKDCNHR